MCHCIHSWTDCGGNERTCLHLFLVRIKFCGTSFFSPKCVCQRNFLEKNLKNIKLLIENPINLLKFVYRLIFLLLKLDSQSNFFCLSPSMSFHASQSTKNGVTLLCSCLSLMCQPMLVSWPSF